MAVPSPLASLRLRGTKQIFEEKSQELQFDRSDPDTAQLIGRFLLLRDFDGKPYSESYYIESVNKDREALRSRTARTVPDDLSEEMKLNFEALHRESPLITAGDELAAVQDDLKQCFQQGPPNFTLDYISRALAFLKLFDNIERRLRDLRNPVYVEVFEKKPPGETPRVSLVEKAMSKMDKECLRVMAEEIQNSRSLFDFDDFSYFKF